MKKNKEQQHEEYVQIEMSRCVHFTGIQNSVCKAKVNIRELVGGPDLGWASRLPCLSMDAEKCEVTCSVRKLPTREEAEAEVLKDQQATARHMKAIVAAHNDAKNKGYKKGAGGRDSMPCPLECGGKLHYSVASYNGHMHAKCETVGCVSWME